MSNLLLSRFETYLLDEAKELEYQQDTEEVSESLNVHEFPPGFFSSL